MRRRTKQAEILMRALEQRTIEQQQLAEHLGVVPTSVTKWIREERPDNIPPHHWRKITAFLRIPWQHWVHAAEEKQVRRYRQIYGSLTRQL